MTDDICTRSVPLYNTYYATLYEAKFLVTVKVQSQKTIFILNQTLENHIFVWNVIIRYELTYFVCCVPWGVSVHCWVFAEGAQQPLPPPPTPIPPTLSYTHTSPSSLHPTPPSNPFLPPCLSTILVITGATDYKKVLCFNTDNVGQSHFT